MPYSDILRPAQPANDERLFPQGYVAVTGWTQKILGISTPSKINGVDNTTISKINGV